MSLQRKRPSTAKPTTTIPIYIDETEVDSELEVKFGQTITNSKGKLNQMVPQFPAFGVNSKSTSLLYSKFIMKDMKKDKIPFVKRAFKKKQEITEAQTQKNQKSKHITKEPSQKGTTINDKNYLVNDDPTLDKQFNNFFRASSAKTFQKKDTLQVEKTKSLIKNKSQARLVRPKTAKQSKNKQFLLKRPTSSHNQGFYNTIEEKDPTRLYDNAMKIREVVDNKIKPVDHIKKNVRGVSAYSKKCSSIYLTGAQITDFKAKLKQNKQKEEKNEFDTFLEQRKTSQLRPEEKKKIEERSNAFAEYLKQIMPGSFIQAFQKNEKQSEKDISFDLLEMGFDKPEQLVEDIVEEIKVEEYYKDLERNCEFIQLRMKKRVETQSLEEKPFLDILQCRKILQLNSQLEKTSDQTESKSLIQQIYQIIKVLAFFKDKPEEQNVKLLNLPFKIEMVQEEQVIINNESTMNFVYIILNGSVTSRICELHDLFEEENQPGIMSLYDGQSFGQHIKPTQALTVVALEQSIVMKFPYQNYKNQFLSGSELEQKVKILKLVFDSEITSNLLKEEDLEMLSLYLQKKQIESKKIVFRKGDEFNFLMFVGKGQLIVINEQIIKRKKDKIKDVKYRPKTQKHQWRKESIPTIYTMRKENLINHQLLKENHSNIYYYQQTEEKALVQGDSLNWNFAQEILSEEDSALKNHQSPQKMPYSVMSNSNETRIYTISQKGLRTLPSELKKVLFMKSETKCKEEQQLRVDKTMEMNNWEKYKTKLCREIINSKKKL